MEQIVRLKLDKICRRVADSYGAKFVYTDAVVKAIRNRCTEVDTGARNVDHILNRSMLPELSSQVLASLAEGRTIQKIAIDMVDDQFKYDITGESTIGA